MRELVNVGMRKYPGELLLKLRCLVFETLPSDLQGQNVFRNSQIHFCAKLRLLI